MFERLYQCTQALSQHSDQHQKLIQYIQANIHADLDQRTLMKLMNDCRQASPLKTQENDVDAIKNIQQV
ncbi:hypothetical protein AMD27_11210 [Acinetobacter sp. TGL-Y2]|uniref:hypothetical protein n=1 Tax=Acinetobacter sp. TGL-Y2 TaxID=1407071 RepID=UPI0007A659A4|nr:hypothetical protein [Acinetobacter sp. TGL-Y2]AMW79402.1 hypothetical protein AMD27_11210 [Acinetobacter sp. TGL-Y2]